MGLAHWFIRLRQCGVGASNLTLFMRSLHNKISNSIIFLLYKILWLETRVLTFEFGEEVLLLCGN